MFIGEDGLRRVVQRTLALMREHDTDDVRARGGINLDQIQRFFNFWAPRIFDLFGNDESKRAFDAFRAGIKGRVHESGHAEHVRLDEPVHIERRAADRFETVAVPERDALNGAMRQSYLKEVDALMGRLNRLIERSGVAFRLRLPSPRFNRKFGVYAGQRFAPDGEPVTEAGFAARANDWLPTLADRSHLAAVMQPIRERGKLAGWIAPPLRGINNQPALDFEYVRLS